MPVSGDVYRIWRYHCPLFPDVLAAYGEDSMSGYLGPNGRLYKGTWTFFGKAHNIYSDQVIDFSQEEYPESSIIARLSDATR
jgi:hypothetical protein